MTIREEIVKYLKDNNRQSIKEISGAIKERENVVRTKIYDKKYGLIAKGIVVNVAHIGRRNYFSLKENVPNDNNLQFLTGLFEKGAIKVYKSKITQEEIKKLEAI